jgi:flavodoxin
MVSVLILFASTSGNTEMVVGRVAEVLRGRDIPVTLQRAELSRPEDLTTHDVNLLACGTYGHGLLEYNMDKFVRAIEKTTPSVVQGRSFAVIGLGDGKYDPYYHIESANTLEALVKDHGGTLIAKTLRINKSPITQLDGGVTRWAESFCETLSSL